MTCINYSALTLMLPILLLAASAPAYSHPYNPMEAPKVTCQGFANACPGEGSYTCCDGLACNGHTVIGASICLPPLVPGPDGQYPGCRSILNPCIEYGEYDCCGELSCVPSYPVNPVGAGICLPMGRKKESTYFQCQKQHQLCQPYGQYGCCPGLTCLDPRTLSPPPFFSV